MYRVAKSGIRRREKSGSVLRVCQQRSPRMRDPHSGISCRGQKSSGDLARDAPRFGIFRRNGTGRRWMGSSMVGVALWVGVAGSIQGGFVRRRRHHGVNEYSVYASTLLSMITESCDSWRIDLSFKSVLLNHCLPKGVSINNTTKDSTRVGVVSCLLIISFI